MNDLLIYHTLYVYDHISSYFSCCIKYNAVFIFFFLHYFPKVWIALFHVLMDEECQSKYEFDDYRKNVLLKVSTCPRHTSVLKTFNL